MAKMQARSVNIIEDGNSLAIEWQSGKHDILDAQQLWRDCPSAHARRRRMDHPHIKPDTELRIVSVAAIGLYAINIGFSDGHARGVYPWPLLKQIATKPAVADYLVD
jgi:DUF971 family protein